MMKNNMSKQPDGSASTQTDRPVPIIDLAMAPGERQAWDRPRIVIYLWAIVELLFVTNPWQISSKLRIRALTMFGATIANGVVFRPRTRVKFPWKLHIGESSWVGEGVWIHNQDDVWIGSNVVLSQDTFVTTGSHALRTDMSLITKPVRIGDGAWITSRCIILGGVDIGESSVVTPNTVVPANSQLPANKIFGGPPPTIIGERFEP
jgi:putative colanic acid biosynthesis acetyltransferase WcaF